MANPKNSADFIDVHAILKSYLSKWYIFVISAIVCSALGYVYVKTHPRDMAVRANILISQGQDGAFGATAEMPMPSMGSLFGSNGYVDDEIFIISSHSLYRNVAKTLQINKMHYVKTGLLGNELAYPTFPVDVVAPGVADTLRTTLAFKIKVNDKGVADIKVKAKRSTVAKVEDVKLPATVKTPYGNFTVEATPTYPKGESVNTTVLFSGYETAAEELTDNIIADIASRNSNVITLSFDTPNADYGAAVLDEVLVKYNERGVSDKNVQGEKTASFLTDRIDLLSNDLTAVEKEVQEYKEKNGLVNVGVEVEYQTAKKGTVEEALLKQEAEVELLKITRDFLADSVRTTEMIPTTVDNQQVQNGINTYNDLVLKRIELSSSAKQDNKVMSTLNRQMEAARKSVLSSAAIALRGANMRLSDLRAEVARADARLGNIPEQERQFRAMSRTTLVKGELYLFLLKRQEENAMMMANSVAKGKIIDNAYTLIEPLGMSPKVVIAIAFIIGLILPVFGIYIYKALRNKFENRAEVERKISAPILGEMCVDRSGRIPVVTRENRSSATELFRLLRANLQFMLNGEKDKVVLLTSTRSGEGKTFISINLAASLSLLEGKRVLLVGMDIRNPQLSNYLNFHPRFGLTNYLASSDLPLSDIINPMPGFDSFDIIVAGPIPPNPAEMLESRKVDELFEKLRGMYDYVVVDSAPVGMVSDSFTLDRIADATVYVTRVNYSSMADLRFIENIYTEKRLKKLSVVVNGTNAHKGYGYGYNEKQAKKS